MWLWTPLSKKVGWVLAVLLVLAALVIMGLLVMVLMGSGPQAVESWKAADSYERDTVIVLLLIISLFSKTECKCKGGCSK